MQEIPYIETLGESFYEESPKRYSAVVTITASLLDGDSVEVSRLCGVATNSVSNVLKSFQSKLESISSGGAKFDTVTNNRGATIISLERRYIVASQIYEHVDDLIVDLAELVLPEHCTIDCRPNQPEYEPTNEQKQQAYSKAVIDARANAEASLHGSSQKSGSVLSIKQLALSKRSSGAFGDDDWWGDSDRFTARIHVGGRGGELNLNEPSRVIFVRFLVRFALVNRE